jgi:hypothetical protein
MRSMSRIAYLIFWITGYFAARNAMGPDLTTRLVEALFGDYIRFWDVHGLALPVLTNPLVLVMGTALLATALPIFLVISRWLASAVIALFMAKLALMATGSAGADAPALSLGLAAMFSVGWLCVLATIGDRSLILWLRDRRRVSP